MSIAPLFAVALSATVAAPAAADGLLFKDVRIFDGVSPELTAGHVLVLGRHIETISTDPAEPIDPPDGVEVIEGRGRILSPGFIDLHAHVSFQVRKDQLWVHPTVKGAVAGDALKTYLHHGFTTIRDAGGTHPDLARAVDEGLIVGPRVFPSGAIVSQTAGHGDFRAPHDPHPALCACGFDATLADGLTVIADGVPLTLAAVRENLRAGATQIKIMGGGGVASDYDPIHSLQPSPDEIRAAVQAAGDFGTYVMAHAYTSEAVQRLVENGVKVIEHGLLIDDATARLCAEKEIVISTQVLVFRAVGDMPGMSDRNREKLAQVLVGQDRLMGFVKKYGLKIGFGTDLVFGMVGRVSEEFTARTDYFTPAEILRQATSESAEVVRLAGKLNRHGDFGEIREGWLADLLLIEGDPFADISILEDPERSLAVIVKDGEVVVRR